MERERAWGAIIKGEWEGECVGERLLGSEESCGCRYRMRGGRGMNGWRGIRVMGEVYGSGSHSSRPSAGSKLK